MGGKGSGGRRVGSGRKPLPGSAQWWRRQHEKNRPESAAPSVLPEEPICRPKDLAPAATAIWAELAPAALEAGTLVPATAHAFGMMCRVIALERQIAADPERVGGADHRGVTQRATVLLASFMLLPPGRPLPGAKKHEHDPFAEFDPIRSPNDPRVWAEIDRRQR